MSQDEVEILHLTRSYSIELKFSHTVADGKELISAKDGTDRTGLLVWRGARVFYDWCVKDLMRCNIPKEQFIPSRNINVIELGGGLGFGSMITGGILDVLRARWPSASPAKSCRVLCTDFFLPALDLAQEQIRINTSTEESKRLSNFVSTAQLDWCWSLSESADQQQKLDAFCSTQPGLAQRASESNHSHHQDLLLLLALDCVYPDTRNDVLCGLFVTIKKLLLLSATKKNKNSQLRDKDKLFDDDATEQLPYLIMTFVERDVGLTLRRLITAASVCGLKVDPLELPVLADSKTEIKLFGKGSATTSSDGFSPQEENSCRFSFIRDGLRCKRIDKEDSPDPSKSNSHIVAEVWSRMKKAFVSEDADNKNKTWFSCCGATWILKIQLAVDEDDDDVELARKCEFVIESLTNEVDGFLASSKSLRDEEQLHQVMNTLKKNGLLESSHFNHQWWNVFPYLAFKDPYLAARSILRTEEGAVMLDPILVEKVLEERRELADDTFMLLETEDLF